VSKKMIGITDSMNPKWPGNKSVPMSNEHSAAAEAARAACWIPGRAISGSYSEHPPDCGSCKAIAAAIDLAVAAERDHWQAFNRELVERTAIVLAAERARRDRLINAIRSIPRGALSTNQWERIDSTITALRAGE